MSKAVLIWVKFHPRPTQKLMFTRCWSCSLIAWYLFMTLSGTFWPLLHLCSVTVGRLTSAETPNCSQNTGALSSSADHGRRTFLDRFG